MGFGAILYEIFLEGSSSSIDFSPKNLTSHYQKELGDIDIDEIYVATDYHTLEYSIHRYKYFSDRDQVHVFVDLLAKLVDGLDIISTDDIAIVPVPMHWMRYFIRGLNHTGYIAKLLSKDKYIPMIPALSTKWTKHQSKLSRQKRLENKKNSIRITYRKPLPSTIILIDDVISTGSTANECAKALKSIGVKRVVGIFLTSNY